MTVKDPPSNHFPILLLFFFFLFLPNPTHQIVKCNRRLMKEFGLKGMDYSINDQMYVCGYVIDKCCTVQDEITVYKLWNDYTKPIVDIRVDETMTYAFGIVRMFFRLMKLDPQLIILKFITFKKVPYDNEVCFSRMKQEEPMDSHEFERYHDTKARYQNEPAFHFNPANRGKKFKTRKYTHDILGRRHWGNRLSKIKSLKMYRIKKYNSPSFSLPPIDINQITCKREQDTYYKEFVIVNEEKTTFCLGLYRRFLRLDNRYLMRFLPQIKNMMRQVNYIKSSFYCSICDAHQQKYFDVEKKTIMISDNFCKRLLVNKMDFFTFMHVFFIEYMDEFLQYVQCFETDGKVFSFPFHNFLVKYKRRIPLYQSCFAALGKKDFMTKCWFICSKYKLLGFNPIFDGDIKLLKRVYLTIFSFLHKLDMSRDVYNKLKDKEKNPLIVKGNVNGMMIEKLNEKINGPLMEPLNPSHAITTKYYIEKNTRKKLLGKLDTRIKPKKSKKTYKAINTFLGVLGLPSFQKIIKLKKAHKILKLKHKFLLKKHKFLITRKPVRKYLKMLYYKRKNSPNPNKHKKGYSKVNGLKDHLFVIKRRFKIHAGFRPQRVLLENKDIADEVRKAFKNYGISDSEIEHQIDISKQKARFLLENKVDDEKTPKKAKDPNRFKAKHVVTESASEIYHKSLPHFQVSKFDLTYNEDGIRPLRHFALINYRFNITTLINRKFQMEERLDDSVVQNYFLAGPRTINKFNFDLRTFLLDSGAIKHHKFDLHKKVLRYAKRKKRIALATFTRISMKKIIKREAKARHRKEMWKKMLKKRKKQKMLKAMMKHHRRVKKHDHIETEHFYSNFHKIWELFVKIFGT